MKMIARNSKVFSFEVNIIQCFAAMSGFHNVICLTDSGPIHIEILAQREEDQDDNRKGKII